MHSNLRIMVFLILSSFVLGQPVPDSIKTVSNEVPVPVEVKPVVNEIVINIEESKRASFQINNEMKKQLELVKEIKQKITQFKKHPKSVKVTIPKDVTKKDTLPNSAVKPSSILIEVDGQIVQWETKNRTWVGRLLHKNDFIYYPFILDKDGNKIYLK